MTEKFIKTAAKTGITMILTPVFTPPLDTAVGGRRTTVQLVDVNYFDGKYTFGFGKLKRWIDLCKRNDMNKFEISHLFTQWGSGNAPLIIVKTQNGYEEKFGWHTDAIGKEYSASEQFSNLYEVCKTIATQSEIGWRLEFNGTSLNLVCFEGTDRTQTVQFSTSFDSLANGEFVDSSESFANAIYVGGKGQNDDRDIYEGESAIEGNSPAGLDRFESWDNQSSMTTESEYETEALSMLNQYGQTLTMSGNGLAKCPYEYEKEYFTGDKIKIAFSGKSANAQILSVTEHWAFGSYEINFSFGKPLPDLNAQLQLMLKQIQKASNKTNSKDSVRWYDIPTDAAMPAADVTYNTIGFIGNVGSGATFTLYRDSSGTGSKTYHVYFKQLGGSGKLTLTTGVSGSTNLVLNSGTYVAVIYLDENGNITSQGMTATGLIETGNNQPVESGAVADEISNLTEIASSLPTDAVLHYSFDEVPDYPDGTADVRLLDNNTYDIQSNNSFKFNITSGTTAVNNNGKLELQMQGTSTSTNNYINVNNIANKIIKIIFEITEITAGEIRFGNNTNTPIVLTALGKYEYIYNNGTNNRCVFYAPNGSEGKVVIEQIYIGNGSYSTPIIDNANGQWNSISQSGFVTSQGISGKCPQFYSNQKTIEVNYSDSNWDRAYTVSCWGKVKEGNLYIVGYSNYSIANHLIRYSSSAKNIFFDVNENTRFIGYTANVDLNDDKWHHIVCVNKFKAGESEIWIDGIKQLLTKRSREVLRVHNTFLIGTTKNSGNTYYEIKGNLIDDFQIFDRALSDKEILAIYQNKANTPKYYDLSDYKLKEVKENAQPQTLATPITIGGQSYTTVESALQALAGAI